MEWLILGFFGGLAGLYFYRQHSLLVPVVIDKDSDALYQTWAEIPYSIGQPTSEGHWNRAILVITQQEIRLQTKQEKGVRFNALNDELRGFWILDKTAFLHAHIGTAWYVVQLRSLDTQFIAGLEQVTQAGYFSDLGATTAHFNHKQVILYLAPQHLVILTGGLVQHTLSLASIDSISTAADTLTFSTLGQSWVFTLPDAEQWAQAIRQGKG